MGPEQQKLTDYTHEVTQHLQEAGFPLSEKSNLTAARSQIYIGKQYQADMIQNTPARLAKLLMLFSISVTAPYLSPKYLERLLGVAIYSVNHNNGYIFTAFLRTLVRQGLYTSPTPFFRTSLASIWGQAMTPWRLQGFFNLIVPESPKVYIDAGPQFIGIVFQLEGTWMCQSFPLPSKYQDQDIAKRQQQAELYGVLLGLKLCIAHRIQAPTFVLDSTSAFGTCLKGSTTANWPRIRLLTKIQIIPQRTGIRVYLNLINTRFHPADYPSRHELSLQPVPATVLAQLRFIATHPALITADPIKFEQDTSRQAWSTPDWMRWIITKSPIPPTQDLFADQTSALCPNYFSQSDPFNPAVLKTGKICFYQPPYKLLSDTWQQCRSHLPTPVGFWGLTPKSFYLQQVRRDITCHICACNQQVNYYHPTLPGTRAAFKSTLFFIPGPSQPCLCSYLNLDITKHH